MQLFVRDDSGRSLVVDVAPGADVASLKASLVAQGAPCAAEQLVSFGGRPLADAQLLEELDGITEGSTLFVDSGLAGGGKKRKKKTYTKPKKIKHKRKKVKLAVLKFYKVDSNDKVTRLRRECPHELCGPGVFMAMHFNRYYCGKCHLTYLIKKGDEK
mmetsp:Transcript_88640/g.255713  ORF Transcript_88640/g.255713 Transcript_88640/m.255713 type:complete len:158 (-) Transcript_88640:70-543(-)